MATIDDDGGDNGGTSGDGGIRNSQRMHFIGARRMPSKKVDEPRTRRDCNSARVHTRSSARRGQWLYLYAETPLLGLGWQVPAEPTMPRLNPQVVGF